MAPPQTQKTRMIWSKLVRDGIVAMGPPEGIDLVYDQISGLTLQCALAEKLHEEADEVKNSLTDRKELMSELGDVLDIVDQLIAEAGIDRAELDATRAKKMAKKGGFAKGYFVHFAMVPTTHPMHDEWSQRIHDYWCVTEANT